MAKKEKPDEWQYQGDQQMVAPLLAELAEKTSELLKLENILLNRVKDDVLQYHENELKKKEKDG